MWAFSLLRRRPGRVLLTVLGVALAVGLTTTMLSIAAGLDSTSKRVLADTGVDIVIVKEGADVISSSHPPFANGTGTADDLQLHVAGVRTAFPIFEKTVTLYPANYASCQAGCPPVNPLANGENPGRRGGLSGLDMVEGAYFQTLGDPFNATAEYRNHLYPDGFNSSSFTREILLNRAVARELNTTVGGTIFLSLTRSFNGSQPFHVVGIYEASFETDQSREVRVHLSELQYMDHRERDEATLIAIDLADPSAAPNTAAAIHARYPGLRAATSKEILGELDRAISVFSAFAGLIAGVSIAVAVLFAATIFMISVRERIGEIAALRAIGISRRTIFTELVLESAVVGALALAIGSALGVVGAWAIDFVLKTTTSRVPHGMNVAVVTPDVLLVVAATSVVIGIVAGLAPAVWATRVSIASNIRNL
jgi:putative ABC transport system permease protein